MSDAEFPDTNPDSAEAKFAQIEQELVQETSVIALMKDQMTSMFGMVFMFVITIVLALYIRPWYDVAELHAFGEAGLPTRGAAASVALPVLSSRPAGSSVSSAGEHAVSMCQRV